MRELSVAEQRYQAGDGLSISQVAEKVGVSRQTLHSWSASPGMSKFPRHGSPVTVAKDSLIRASPLDTRHWEAARTMDDRRRDWSGASAKRRCLIMGVPFPPDGRGLHRHADNSVGFCGS